MELIVRFWGVRGSIASPGAEMAGVGGNTSAIEIEAGPRHLVLDAGTGLRAMGESLARRGVHEMVLCLSHLHWDHIQGLPFFRPGWMPTTSLRIVGSRSSSAPSVSLEEALASQMTPPHFPVRLADMRARRTFTELGEGEALDLGEVALASARLNHPDGVTAYRIDCGGRAVVYATDVEHGTEADERLIALARGADVLIYDAMYTDDEYAGRRGPSRAGWGHSTWQEGCRIADRAGVGRLVLFHHDPARTDAEVEAIEAQAAAVRPGTVAAREGLEIRLGARVAAAA
jgi:phosphoribosyl 1,2-cyclic phosphodiesterase